VSGAVWIALFLNRTHARAETASSAGNCRLQM